VSDVAGAYPHRPFRYLGESQTYSELPSRARQEAFQSILREHRVTATLRREKGHDIATACGQLRLQTKLSAAASSGRNAVRNR
jgi:adenine C2-methylase RlmN of 23S rRNA A2503 and tRNA A37